MDGAGTMYLGLDSTVLASALHTRNPPVILLGSDVTAVHHTIVLGEEASMRRMFGPGIPGLLPSGSTVYLDCTPPCCRPLKLLVRG
jgi:hypothetical protein